MSHDHDNMGIDTGLSIAASEGCEESRILINRRHLLGVSAGFFSWAYMPTFAQAGTADDPRVLFVILRGGMDGLNVVVPYGDKTYYTLRGELAIPEASTIKVDSFFGLHPALVNFGAMYKAKEGAVIHAVAPPLRNRSHFDVQDNLETGMPNQPPVGASGWLNRLLTSLKAGDSVKVGGAVQIGNAPVIMRGAAPVLGWSPRKLGDISGDFYSALQKLYASTDKPLGEVLGLGLKANEMALGTNPGAVTEKITDLQKAFRGAARLMAAEKGPRISVLSVGGFDTHLDQGGVTGALATLLRALDTGLGDFKATIGDAWRKTVVVCVTEFGRAAAINGSSGTDHGVGTVALLAGGAVAGGKVYGEWPGLGAKDLYEGRDLKPTTDLRSVFKGVLQDHLDVSNDALNNEVFPGSSKVPVMSGLVKFAVAPPFVTDKKAPVTPTPPVVAPVSPPPQVPVIQTPVIVSPPVPPPAPPKVSTPTPPISGTPTAQGGSMTGGMQSGGMKGTVTAPITKQALSNNKLIMRRLTTQASKVQAPVQPAPASTAAKNTGVKPAPGPVLTTQIMPPIDMTAKENMVDPAMTPVGMSKATDPILQVKAPVVRRSTIGSFRRIQRVG